MKRRGLTIVILVILGVIIGVILFDFVSNRPDRMGDNPYALDMDQYRVVDEALISHVEKRNFSLGELSPTSFDLHGDTLFIAGKNSLAVVPKDGSSSTLFPVLPDPTCILATDDQLLVGYKDFIAKYDHRGRLVERWDALGDRTVITNLALKGERLYVADAGNRRIVMMNLDGDLTGEFRGGSGSGNEPGFIVPSPSFDLAVDPFGELWVVNPGKHALENYTDDGELRGFWESASVEIGGFMGCCNPARITVMNDGSFVTSEKGLVRIKIHDQSGRLKSVVAPPRLFKVDGKAPDVCVDGDGVVYALDFDRETVRIFEPIQNG